MGRTRSTPWGIGCAAWLKKYFWEGQTLHHEVEDHHGIYSSWGAKFVDKYRRVIGLLVPAIIYHFCWWSIGAAYNLFPLFLEKWKMSITMVIGGTVAGMTSEGGGAVAFPVMTLLLGVPPEEARDFALYIQATGMSGATFAIIFMGVQVEWHAIVFGTISGIVGLILGLEFVDPHIPAAWKKMCFVSIWFSFAFALFFLNRLHKRHTYIKIPHIRIWKIIVLICGGFVGGIFTSFAGSGLDICIFSIITLLFRVSEKTATPTSVVCMALASQMGAFWRTVIKAEVAMDTFEYLFVTGPIVMIMAPTGSVLGTHFHRQVLAAFIYILDTAALISAFVIVKQTPLLTGISVGIIVGGGIFFFILTRLGGKLLDHEDKILEQKIANEEKDTKQIENGHAITDGITEAHVNPAYSSDSIQNDFITVSKF